MCIFISIFNILLFIVMKIFITGSNGFLGQHLCKYFLTKEANIIASGKGSKRIPFLNNDVYVSLDLTNQDAVENEIVNIKPDIIIHTAAMSKPDECNNNPDACIACNIHATKYLTQAAQKVSAKLIYISTDFIFGENGPHAENTIPAPLNFYGQTKLDAEKLITAAELNYAIVRPVFIYGNIWEGLRPSFLHWVKNNLEQQKKIKVVSDQLRTPTYVYDICKGIDAIISQNATGVYHLAGKDIISPYQMAMTVADVLKLDNTFIENVTSETFPEPVQRAKKSGLLIHKAILELNYAPVSFAEGVTLSLL